MTFVVPMIAYEDGTAAMDWLIEAFGFVEADRRLSRDGRLTHGELEKLRQVDHHVFRADTLDATFPVAEGPAALERAMERLCREASAATAEIAEAEHPVPREQRDPVALPRRHVYRRNTDLNPPDLRRSDARDHAHKLPARW